MGCSSVWTPGELLELHRWTLLNPNFDCSCSRKQPVRLEFIFYCRRNRNFTWVLFSKQCRRWWKISSPNLPSVLNVEISFCVPETVHISVNVYIQIKCISYPNQGRSLAIRCIQCIFKLMKTVVKICMYTVVEFNLDNLYIQHGILRKMNAKGFVLFPMLKD